MIRFVAAEFVEHPCVERLFSTPQETAKELSRASPPPNALKRMRPRFGPAALFARDSSCAAPSSPAAAYPSGMWAVSREMPARILALALLLVASPVAAERLKAVEFRLDSKVLGEERRLLVSLPSSYKRAVSEGSNGD